jgi:site-specific DNA-methyltransferase (adenine-specific)
MARLKAPTLRALRQTAKALGLRGYSKLGKADLTRAIGKASAPVAPAIIAPPSRSPRCELIAGNELWLGDCLEILPRLADRQVHHVITDPPYESSLHESKGKAAGRLRTDGRADLRTLDFEPIDKIRARVVEMVQVCCERWFIVFATVEGVAEWARVINPSRIKYKRACIWIKPDATPQLNAQGPAQGAECFVASWAGRGHANWNSGGKRGVYTHNIRQPGRDGRHPTEKPLTLMREIVLDFSRPGELVCDPFMGSGTTGVAAVGLGRRFVGIERNPDYFAIACERIERASKQPDLFIAPAPLRPKERRATSPQLDLPALMLPSPVPTMPAQPMHFKDDGETTQFDLEDYLAGDRRSE